MTSTLALLITSSGGITTAMAHNKNVALWTTVTGVMTTIAGTVMGGIRAMGQPRRAEDRVRRLERIVEHIGRLYYSVGSSDLQSDTQETIKQTWKMIDEEEDRSELEERKAGSFGYRIQSPPPLAPPQQTPPPLPESTAEQDDADPSKHFIRPRLKMRRASTLLGKHFPSYDSDLRSNRV